MRNRLQATGLVLLILIVGIGLTAVITEYEAGAGAAGPRLLTTDDAVAAMTDAGVDLTTGQQPAHHPLLSVAGTNLTTGTGQIEVYVYPDVASRVADEQRIQRRFAQLQVFATDDDALTRVTSAQNVLLLFDPGSSDESAQIYAAARTLASSDESRASMS